MSFAEWKKRSKTLKSYFFEGGMDSKTEAIAKAAYKAGERQGWKDIESLIAVQSFEYIKDTSAWMR